MRDRRDIERLKDMAHARIGELLSSLGVSVPPRGLGNYVALRSPVRTDKNASLVIWTKGGSVAFKDYGSGAQGDVFGLIAYLKQWDHQADKGFADARRWLEDRLGLRHLSARERTRLAEAARKSQATAQAEARRDDAARRASARALFHLGEPVLGTLAETYLRHRGIDLTREPFRGPRGGELAPGALRFIRSLIHIDHDGNRESMWPAMIAAIVDYAGHYGMRGRVVAVHRTWLARDGKSKAPVNRPKMVLGSYQGCVIPLWRGSSGLPALAAMRTGLRETVALYEGIEDGLTGVLAAPAYRTWAVISLGNLGNVPALDLIDSALIHRQNDWTKLQAVEQFDRAKTRLENRGWAVSEIHASTGKDINDTLRG